jgi:hypothetical protein
MAPCSYVNDATANELGSLLLIKVSLKGFHVPYKRRLSTFLTSTFTFLCRGRSGTSPKRMAAKSEIEMKGLPYVMRLKVKHPVVRLSIRY